MNSTLDISQLQFKQTKTRVVIPVSTKLLFFDNLQKEDHLLFLYDRGVEPHEIFASFMANALKNGEICLYAFDSNNNLSFSDGDLNKFIEEGKLHTFPLKNGNAPHPSALSLDDFIFKLSKMDKYLGYKSYTNARLLIDFGSICNKTNIDQVIECIDGVNKKIREQSYRKLGKAYYRQKYSKLGQYSLIAISAFNIESMDYENLKQLINLHEKVVVCSQNRFQAQLPNFISNGHLKPTQPSIDTISQETMDQFVKKNLESILLFLLHQKPMCGYELIKTIFTKFNVLLSQGTVYPLLYSFASQGLLKIDIGEDNKTKVYVHTEDGKITIQNKLIDFTKTLEYIMTVISQ